MKDKGEKMEKKLKTQEAALKRIKQRMAQKEKTTPVYDDWWYGVVDVDVYKVSFMDGTFLYAPRGIGEQIQNEIMEEEKPSAIKLGGGVWKMYEVKNVLPEKVRFAELSDWAKHKTLEEQPEIFGEKYKNFSPELKLRIDKLKKGEKLDSNLKIRKG